jgi:hypothetical protein
VVGRFGCKALVGYATRGEFAMVGGYLIWACFVEPVGKLVASINRAKSADLSALQTRLAS